MEETLVEVRTDAAPPIAQQKTLARHMASANKEVEGWQHKAQIAMNNDKESLAKAALIEKQKYVAKLAFLKNKKRILHRVSKDPRRYRAPEQ